MSELSSEFSAAAENLSKAQEALAVAGKKETDRIKRENNSELRKQEAREYAAQIVRIQSQQKLIKNQELLAMVDPDQLKQDTPDSTTTAPTPAPAVVASPVVVTAVPPTAPVMAPGPAPAAVTVIVDTPEPQEASGLPKATVVDKKPKNVKIIFTSVYTYFSERLVMAWALAFALTALVLSLIVMILVYGLIFPDRPESVRIFVCFILIPLACFMIGGLIGARFEVKRLEEAKIVKTNHVE